VCTVLGLSIVWPQVFRVFRVGVEGISPRGQLHALSGGCLWTVYGLAKMNPPLIAANAVALVLGTIIAVMMVRHQKMPAWHLIAVLVGFLGLGAGMSLISPAITAWLAIIIGATSILPQAWYVLRYANLSGLSAPMYVILVVSGSLWFAYGIVIGDLLVSAPNLLILPCAALIGTKALRYQRRTARSAAEDTELATA
jgi:uncharacterized protein with PQ loop repeat